MLSPSEVRKLDDLNKNLVAMNKNLKESNTNILKINNSINNLADTLKKLNDKSNQNTLTWSLIKTIENGFKDLKKLG